MESISVRIVVFWHEDQNRYCSYCPALHCFFGKGSSVAECVQIVKEEYLLWYLRIRNKCRNLIEYGWKVSESSVTPPLFTDEECLAETEKLYPKKVNEPQFLTIEVVLPKAET